MDRAIVNRADRPSGRKRLDTALVVAAGVVVLFAVVGVVSAGSFVAGKVSGNTTKATATVKPATSSALVAQNIHRAQAQATAIVRQAQRAGHSIVTSANANARRQANAVIATARRQAASYKAAARASVAAAPVPTAVPSTSSNTAGNTGTFVQPVVSPTSVSSFNSVGTSSGIGTNAGSTTGATVPNLSGLPATWLVVGYNATFGSGSDWNRDDFSAESERQDVWRGGDRKVQVGWFGQRILLGAGTGTVPGVTTFGSAVPRRRVSDRHEWTALNPLRVCGTSNRKKRPAICI